MQQVKRKFKMLLVDNNRLIHTIIKEKFSSRILITSAMKLDEAESKLMSQDLPDIVVLYLHTDGEKSGYQLLEMIRSSDVLAKTLVILLGRCDDFEYSTERIEAFQRGADYCLAKPFDPEEFVGIIAALLRIKGLLNYNETL